jgi:hypothetical protein
MYQKKHLYTIFLSKKSSKLTLYITFFSLTVGRTKINVHYLNKGTSEKKNSTGSYNNQKYLIPSCDPVP